jgi:predicted Rossmann-fold nucleotide-binding protein
VFYSPNGFWDPLFAVFRHIVAQRLTPPDFETMWRIAERVEDILPTLRKALIGVDEADKTMKVARPHQL